MHYRNAKSESGTALIRTPSLALQVVKNECVKDIRLKPLANSATLTKPKGIIGNPSANLGN